MWAESGLNSSSVREERQVRGLPARPQGNPGGCSLLTVTGSARREHFLHAAEVHPGRGRVDVEEHGETSEGRN